MESTATSPSFVVVDSCCRIKYVSGGSAGDAALQSIVASPVELQPDVEAFLLGIGGGDVSAPVRTAFLSEEHVLRVARLVGEGGPMYVLSVEEDRNRLSLSRAARRHQLTRRETAVLTLILDGSNASEIAATLGISENTVQGYFKRLLSKTGSRNRVAMVASILDWEPQRRAVRPVASVAV